MGIDQIKKLLGLHIRVANDQFDRWLGNNPFDRRYSKPLKGRVFSIDFIDHVQLIERVFCRKPRAFYCKRHFSMTRHNLLHRGHDLVHGS